MCLYNYDYSNYSHIQSVNLSNWITDIFQGTNTSAPQGMDKVAKTRIRDTNFLYATILDFYNQIYSTGFYQNNPGSQFVNIPFLQGYDGFVQQIVDNLYVPLETIYGGPMPSAIKNIFSEVLTLPKPTQNGDKYSLSFQFSYSQYKAYLTATDQVAYLNNTINSLLRDSQGTMSTATPKNTWKPNGPGLVNPTVDFVSAIQLVDNAGNPSYDLTSNIDPNTFTPANYPNYIFGTVQITAQVSVWSPMLVVYFQVFDSSITFDQPTCQLIAQSAGINSPNGSTMPVGCFQQDCDTGNENACKQAVTSFCQINYNPPPYVSSTFTEQYLITQNYVNCTCYTSHLPPNTQEYAGNPAGMCFDQNCNVNDFRSYFGLTDTVCQQYCNQAWQWFNSPDPTQLTAAPQNMDWTRYNNICGQNYTPLTPATINKDVLISGIVISVLVGMLVFSFLKHRKSGTTSIVISVVLTVCIFLGLTGFLSRDLAGISDCENKKFVCLSRITKKPIPEQFCNYKSVCECELDSDCASSTSNCVCVSGICTPQVGTRKTKVIKVRNPNVILIVLGFITGIVLPLTLLYLYEDYHWGISKKVFIPIVLFLGLASISYATYLIFAKRNETVLDGPCTSDKPCTPDCPTGYSCVAGNCLPECSPPCGPGYSCIDSKCVCADPCGDKVCGQDGCKNSCGTCPQGTTCAPYGECLPYFSFSANINSINYTLASINIGNIVLAIPPIMGSNPQNTTLWDYDEKLGVLFAHNTDQALYFSDKGFTMVDTYSQDPKFQGWRISNGVISQGNSCISLSSNNPFGSNSLLPVPSNTSCTAWIQCSQTPCNNFQQKCGTDPCGNNCGGCPTGFTCSNNECVCENPCNNGQQKCGTDPCGNNCGTCPSGFNCVNGECVCANPCNNGQQKCGTDACGNNCGTCATNQSCSPITKICLPNIQIVLSSSSIDPTTSTFYLGIIKFAATPVLMLIRSDTYNSNPSQYSILWNYEPSTGTFFLDGTANAVSYGNSMFTATPYSNTPAYNGWQILSTGQIGQPSSNVYFEGGISGQGPDMAPVSAVGLPANASVFRIINS
jgi:hypothetical protein